MATSICPQIGEYNTCFHFNLNVTLFRLRRRCPSPCRNSDATTWTFEMGVFKRWGAGSIWLLLFLGLGWNNKGAKRVLPRWLRVIELGHHLLCGKCVKCQIMSNAPFWFCCFRGFRFRGFGCWKSSPEEVGFSASLGPSGAPEENFELRINMCWIWHGCKMKSEYDWSGDARKIEGITRHNTLQAAYLLTVIDTESHHPRPTRVIPG